MDSEIDTLGAPSGIHEGARRQFVHTGCGWYRDTAIHGEFLDEVVIGMYYPNDGGKTTGEFAIQWQELDSKATPKLVVFDDAWDALWQFRDLLEGMAQLNGTNPSPERICQLLTSLGIEDATPENDPYRKG